MPIFPSGGGAQPDNSSIKLNANNLLYVNKDNATIQQDSSNYLYVPSIIPKSTVKLFNYEGTNIQNLYFSSDSAGSTKMNSWLESGYSNSQGTTHTWWINLPTGLAANSSVTLYLQISPTTTNNLNTTTTGVAPQLTSTYAEYDNGTNVFTEFYDNFKGTTLNATLWNESSAGVTVNNGVTITSGAANANISTAATYNPQTYMIEAYSYATDANPCVAVGWVQTISGGTPSNQQYFIWSSTTAGTYTIYNYNGTSSAEVTLTTSGSNTSYQTFSVWTNTSESFGMYNYNTPVTNNSDFGALTAVYGLLNSYDGTVYAYYVRMRPLYPNNTAPTQQTGSFNTGGAGNFIPITITNSQSSALSNNTPVMITINNNSAIGTYINVTSYNTTAESTTSTTPVNIDSIPILASYTGTLNILAVVESSGSVLGDTITVSLYNGATNLLSRTWTQEGITGNPRTVVLYYPLSIVNGTLYNINLTHQSSSSANTVTTYETMFSVQEV